MDYICTYAGKTKTNKIVVVVVVVVVAFHYAHVVYRMLRCMAATIARARGTSSGDTSEVVTFVVRLVAADGQFVSE